MRVFIANFGQENYLWPKCLAKSTVATINNEDAQPYWERGDRQGYIAHALANLKTARGQVPTKPVASRWYSLMEIVSETSGDLWIHRAKDELWWTITHPEPMTVTLEAAFTPERDGPRIYELHKPADPWSDRTRKGARLSWNGLHPKAKDFLFTEGTLQQLSPDYAAYALALVNGDDLSEWEDRPIWRTKVANAGRGSAVVYDAVEKSIWDMVDTVKKTVAQANGQQVLKTVKLKLNGFDDEDEFKAYIRTLIKDQEGVCALTGLRLQYAGDCEDPQMLCSLDRIDSSGHYDRDNLQVVCRFANFWKGNGNDEEFKRLLALVRSVTP